MRVVGRLLAVLAAATGTLVVVNHAGIVRLVVDSPEAWDGGRGQQAVLLTLGVFGGGALVMALVALPALLGVFLGSRSRGMAVWFLVVPGSVGLFAAVAATLVWLALQPEGAQLLPFITAPLALPPLLALVAGLLLRARAEVRGEGGTPGFPPPPPVYYPQGPHPGAPHPTG